MKAHPSRTAPIFPTNVRPRARVRASVAGLCLAAILTACRPPAPAASIAFTTVPAAEEGGSARTAEIAGHVAGASPGDRIVIYARSGIWWVQPLVAEPFTTIGPDGRWTSTIHLGTEYAALLVRPGYRPPETANVLPASGGLVAAVSTVQGRGMVASRPAPTLMFSGYEWEVRQTPSDRGGANDYDPANAWVDAAGCLHLKIARREADWASAEVILKRSLGYGTYVFVVRDVSQIDPAAALGLLTWDPGPEQNHRELNVEISRWGDRTAQNAQYVVQPFYMAPNVSRFEAPPGRLTHSIRWEPGVASFRTVAGTRPMSAAAPIAAHTFAAGIPVPGTETVRMNLYYFRHSRTSLQREVEVVIEKFQYLP